MNNGRGFSQLWFDAKGAVVVEFAVVSVFLSLLFIGMIDFGLGFWEKMQVGNAARAGAEWAISNSKGVFDSTVSNGIINAVGLATGLPSITPNSKTSTPAPTSACGCPSVSGGITAAACGASCGAGNGTAATYVTVNAQASYATLFAYPGLTSPITLSAAMTVRIN
jgi:Flp pilus assembly pilin Flp